MPLAQKLIVERRIGFENNTWKELGF